MKPDNTTLGQVLKEARQINQFSLREVEEITEISNAYVSQMENDKIKSPSANILYKLANLYKISFEFLLAKAGVIQEPLENGKPLIGSALYAKDLSSEEERALAEYLAFLRFQNKKKPEHDQST